jgi:hypothetical protein
MAALFAAVPLIASSLGTAAASAGTFAAANAGTILSLAGTAAGVAGSVAAGNAAKAEGKFTAAQMEREAADARAASQREAYMERERGEMVQSRIRAVAADSGAGSINPTVLDLMGDAEQRNSYNVAAINYGGKQKQASYLDNAAGARMKGKNARRASLFDAATTAAGGTYKAFYG